MNANPSQTSNDRIHQPIQNAPNFSLFEFQNSQIAGRRGIDNTIPDEFIPNVEQVAVILQSLRNYLNSPVIITSGYRCETLNRLVGGTRHSYHLRGRAADFVPVVLNTTFEKRVLLVVDWFAHVSPQSYIEEISPMSDNPKCAYWKLYTRDVLGNPKQSALLIVYYKQQFFHLQLY